MNRIYIHRILTSLVAVIVFAMTAGAFDLTHYSQQSVLASGRWVKIAVSRSGLYRLTPQALRQWGFSDPSKIRIYGYGGRRIDDVMTEASYIDDLPMVQTAAQSDGSVVFYGVGPEVWEQAASGRYIARMNPYTTEGYYYVSQTADAEPRQIEKIGTPSASDPVTTFNERMQYEQDLVSPGEGGCMLVGEDFRFTPKRRYTFELPGRDDSQPVWFECSFVAKTFNTSSLLAFEANGESVQRNSSDAVSSSSNDSYGREGRARHTVDMSGERLDLTVTHSSSAMVYGAWLNYIAVNYTRLLALSSGGYLEFDAASTRLSLDASEAAGKALTVWDVTDPLEIRQIDCSDGSSAQWTNPYSGRRSYAAWRDGATLPAPRFAGNVANQNLHATEPVDMVIFTHPAMRQQAERLAAIHRGEPDNMAVLVVNVDEVYNEFSSGSADVGGLRKFLKMLYDRGNSGERKLRFALLMGRATYDERRLTAAMKSATFLTMPSWQLRNESLSLSSTDGFETDDIIAMLDDNSGGDLGLDNLSIAVGRMPVTSARSAAVYVDKINEYLHKSRHTQWKNRILVLADRGNENDNYTNDHINQSESLLRHVGESEINPYIFEKVYLGAYRREGGVAVKAREKMYRTLKDGTAWWIYVGHANNHLWTGDGMLTFNDINNMYLRDLPFIYAATCNFLRWDSMTESGGEIMMGERNGGCIGMISATRSVYITHNGYFTSALGRAIAKRNDDGTMMTFGEIYRNAKNDILNDRGEHRSNENRLRYVFMGDPALRVITPSNLVNVETVGGLNVGGDDQIIIPALGTPVITGTVTAPDGTLLADFNGVLVAEIYDADRSTTTLDTFGATPMTFDEHGDKLFAGSCRITNGRFELRAAMPGDITDNFREATISLYAYSDDAKTEAAGLDRNCYVYGFDESTAADTEAPVIESLVLNHPSFAPGDAVNPDPMLIASVRDNVAINLSTSGIGHQMNIILDGKRTYNDVPFYYTPSSDGSPSGQIAYPIEGLTEGNHTLTLRVFDTSGNAAVSDIDFFVSHGASINVYDIYTDVNPATTEANFYLNHNRPDGMLTVTVSVYNLLGHEIWSETNTGRSDMFVSAPVTWNLCDGAGRRVSRGIYIYRATVSDGENSYETPARKIAVTSK